MTISIMIHVVYIHLSGYTGVNGQQFQIPTPQEVVIFIPSDLQEMSVQSCRFPPKYGHIFIVGGMETSTISYYDMHRPVSPNHLLCTLSPSDYQVGLIEMRLATPGVRFEVGDILGLQQQSTSMTPVSERRLWLDTQLSSRYQWVQQSSSTNAIYCYGNRYEHVTDLTGD